MPRGGGGLLGREESLAGLDLIASHESFCCISVCGSVHVSVLMSVHLSGCVSFCL